MEGFTDDKFFLELVLNHGGDSHEAGLRLPGDESDMQAGKFQKLMEIPYVISFAAGSSS